MIRKRELMARMVEAERRLEEAERTIERLGGTVRNVDLTSDSHRQATRIDLGELERRIDDAILALADERAHHGRR